MWFSISTWWLPLRLVICKYNDIKCVRQYLLCVTPEEALYSFDTRDTQQQQQQKTITTENMFYLMFLFTAMPLSAQHDSHGRRHHLFFVLTKAYHNPTHSIFNIRDNKLQCSDTHLKCFPLRFLYIQISSEQNSYVQMGCHHRIKRRRTE